MRFCRLLALSSIAALGLLLVGCGGRRPAELPASMSLDLGGGVSLELIRVGEGADAYCLGKYEVTQAQYEAVMGENPSYYDEADRANHPVEQVDWHDAMSFCMKLNERCGKMIPEGFAFFLPTESEWKQANCMYDESIAEACWYEENAGFHTHPVGTKAANICGLHDMQGNVWEWCQGGLEWFWDETEKGKKPLRGGGWDSDQLSCMRDASRSESAGYRFQTIGFRVAVSRRDGSR